ncbi:putative transcription factor interactor and regulator CCHC(Zn) family [Helianthus annuus]|nr:putative transcription factor interactor and regulator CCHC(Zn) family [Helianthus annuus]
MNPKSLTSSAANVYDIQQCGIRATSENDEDHMAISSTLQCRHCSDEKKERKWLQKRCYYCNMPGRQIASCKAKEDDEATQLIRLAINTGTQPQKEDDDGNQNDRRLEYMVTGTDGGFWSEIWYVSKSFKRHYSGNLDMFKRIKKMYDVETQTGECNFYFVKGIGVVEVMTGTEKILIQSVFYTPDIDRNVLSLDQLITQGYTVKFSGDHCKIYPTFSISVINRKNDISGHTREDDIGNSEKEVVLKSESEYETFKNEYLNQYFESLNISAEEPDWNVMILKAMSFNEFQDCKALLDMLDDDGYVGKYKFFIEKKFEEMIDWFLKVKLEINTRPLPAYAENNRKVSLLDLYLAVKREGGHRRVTDNHMWAMISKDMGLDYNDGELMRLMYAMYLDVLVYYYKIKTTQQVAAEKEIKEEVGDKRRTRSMEMDEGTSMQSSAEQGGAADEHYAFFAGNDWY